MNIFRKNIGYILTSSITIVSLIFIFFECSIFKESLLVGDLYSEYFPLLIKMRRIFTFQDSFIYSFSTSFGDNFLSIIYYYMSSPLNILSIFIKDINLLVITLVISKLLLCSLFTYKYLKYQFDEEKITYLIIGSILYTLSSFSLKYYLNIMWLDIYMLLPLVLLGIDKIIKEKKHTLYVISTILTILSNYYFAYMIIIFSFLYFNYKVISMYNLKKIIKENIHFIIVTILTIISSSFILLPTISEIGTFSRQNSQLFGGEQIGFTINIYSFIQYVLFGNYNGLSILNEKGYYAFTSITILIMNYLYFKNKRIEKKEKILSGIILSIFIFSMFINYLNLAWHGFVPPSFFNGRFTFLYIMFTILLSIKALYNLKYIKAKDYLSLANIIVLLIFYIVITNNINLFNIIKVIFLIGFTIIFLYINKEKMRYLLLGSIIFELIISGISNIGEYSLDKREKIEYAYNFGKNIDYIKKIENDKFYRIEDNERELYNASTLFDYNGVDTFISTIKKDQIKFIDNISMYDHAYSKNTINFDSSKYLVSSLLNIKYHIECFNNENDYYTYIKTMNDYKIYYNQNALNLGYMVNNLDNINNSNSLEYINEIYKHMTNTNDDILIKVNLNKSNNIYYTFENKKNYDYYVLVKFKYEYNYNTLVTLVNGKEVTDTNNSYFYYVKNDNTKYVDISLRTEYSNDIDNVYVYYINNDVFKKDIKLLKKNQLNITTFKDTYIKGNINVDDNKLLFTSIPYDDNWNVYVDGKLVNKKKVLDTFIGIELESGKHTIEFKYKHKILYLSLIPSSLSLIILIVYLKRKRCTY